MNALLARVAGELHLDQTQRVRYREILESRGEQLRELEQRWAEMRQARAQRDADATFELRDEMLESEGPGALILDVLDELEPTLREDQLEALYRVEDRILEQRERRETVRRLTVDLPHDLKLDDGQRLEFEKAFRSHQQALGGRLREQRVAAAELREARKAGDAHRAEQLEAQLRRLRDDAGTTFEFLTAVERILRGDQKPVLDEYRREFEAPADSAAATQPAHRDARHVLRAARRARLDASQRESVQRIEADALREFQATPRSDRQAHAALYERVVKQIRELLTAEQSELFERRLAEIEGR
ncbi:MAG: hypothetical protein HRF50_06695 [Phycisphaerae bacterium]